MYTHNTHCCETGRNRLIYGISRQFSLLNVYGASLLFASCCVSIVAINTLYFNKTNINMLEILYTELLIILIFQTVSLLDIWYI
jgi:hypothetical protein